jgi:UDP-glucose-4-epimerase GalE
LDAKAPDSSTVLVTGGAGYIGSHAAKALSRAGYRVVVYDNLLAGHREAVRFGELVEGDIADSARLRDTIRRTGASAVVHFAALLAVGESVRHPSRYYLNNVSGTLALLDAMASTGVSRLVFSSTCAVYGEPITTPIDETHPTQPINAYGETKLAIERALPHYARAYGLGSIALRYFNAAGADPDGELGEDHDPEIHLIPRAIQAATGGAPLEIFGDDYPTPDGTCLRDYVHVSDLADAHVLALQALERAASPEARAFNLGTGTPSSVRAVIDAVARATGRPVPANLGPRREGDPAALFAAGGRAARELGWRPSRSDLSIIVQTAWDWHRTHPHGYSGAGRG